MRHMVACQGSELSKWHLAASESAVELPIFVANYAGLSFKEHTVSSRHI